MRVVSLLPSATEIVCASGASSRAIDTAVRDVIANALSIYAIDDAQLAALAPHVIVTQDLCEVCAVSLDDVRAAVARLANRSDVRIVSLSPTRLGDVMRDIERVAAAIDRVDTGRRVRGELEQRIREIAERASRAGTRPHVVSLEWIEPLMIGGTWMPELVELAGGIAVGAVAGAPAPTIDRAQLAALAPDVVVVKPCGFTIERTLAERDVIERDVVTAVPGARVYVTDGNAYFNRPGPRLVESLEIMAACVHPELFADFASLHAEAIVAL